MFDCSIDVTEFHNEKITLGSDAQANMRGRRDANRDRLKKGLQNAKDPMPIEHVSQGSYAMRTMIQHDENDYDIDDGIYFEKADLVGPQGGDKTSLDTRKMVRDAVDDGSFKKAPEVRNNCVRVYYDAGYHVDLPAYRKVTSKDWLGHEQVHYELASSSWVRSDARDVTDWFDEQNKALSPDETNGRQLRRVVRYIKKFAKSRASWGSQILSGFGITKLVTECFRSSDDRDDLALYETMKAIKDRLLYNLVVVHPVTPDTTITTGVDDPKARFLRQKLEDAVGWLSRTQESDCTRDEALHCWDKVFSTDYFSSRFDETKESRVCNKSLGALVTGLVSSSDSGQPEQAVRKQGGGRFA
jgi:hypothetical protein